MTDTKNGRSGPGAENDPGQIAKIESEIDQTRNAITGDLRTLGERLSPEHLKEEAKEVMIEAKHVAVETLHEAKNVATNTYREVKEDALETVNAKVGELRQNVRNVEREAVGFVRENAVPLALIGIGVAWFVSNRRSRDSSWEGDYAPRGQGRWRYPEHSDAQPRGGVREQVSRARGATAEYAARAGERADRWADEAQHQAGDLADQVRGFAEREVELARGLAQGAQQSLGRATARARDIAEQEVRQAREFTRHTTQAHPMALGAAAVAAGVCVGLLIPETRRENELLGPQRERLVSGARDAVSDAKDAISDVKQTAKEAARDVKSSLGSITG